MAEMRRCSGSKTYGIEAHEAPVDDFPKQPSQKDGLGRMCRTHWNQYTNALAKARRARNEADADLAAAESKQLRRQAHKAAVAKAQGGDAPAKPGKGESPTVTARRQSFEKRLAKVGAGSDEGQRMLESAAKANGGSRSQVAEDYTVADREPA